MPEEFQKLEITEDVIQKLKEGLLRDPNITSVEYERGKFHIETTAGSGTLELDFVREKLSGNA